MLANPSRRLLARFRRTLPAAALAATLALFAAAPALAEQAASPAAPTCEEGSSLLPRLEADGRLATVRESAAAVPNGASRFFRVEKDGLPPSYLFGTMHLSDPRVLALPDPVGDAFAESRRVVVETLDVLDEKATIAMLLAHPELINLAPGRRLGDYLTPDQRRMLEEKLRATGTPFQSIETLQPWFFAMEFLMPPCEASRMLGGAEPLDMRLALDARAGGKELVGLETALEQLSVMASMSMDLQISNLIASAEIRDQAADLFETMIELYLAGRIAEIPPLAEALMPVDRTSAKVRTDYAEFEKRVVTDRNHRMAERLRPHLEKGGAFVAVGALHLPGDEGLVALLGARGYRMTRAD